MRKERTCRMNLKKTGIVNRQASSWKVSRNVSRSRGTQTMSRNALRSFWKVSRNAQSPVGQSANKATCGPLWLKRPLRQTKICSFVALPPLPFSDLRLAYLSFVSFPLSYFSNFQSFPSTFMYIEFILRS